MTEVTRSVVICARPEAVFRFFTDGERFARWWGKGSRIDPRPGGEIYIRYPEGTVAGGTIESLDPPRRLVFTYGYEDPKKPIRFGGSRVEVTLEAVADGTRVVLRHSGVAPDILEMHRPGWRFQLSLFAKVAAADVHAGAEARIDDWFRAWSEPDLERRRAALAGVAPDVTFRDDFGCLAGADDILDSIAAAHTHLAATVERDGAIAFCQGSALARWRARKADGTEVATGTNFYDFDQDGRIARVVGFWRF
jgi:uncharacterized protein YndB with AHSA1/START domain